MTIYTAMITLFLILDPFGNIPIYLSFLKKLPQKRRYFVIIREMIIALVILIIFLFFGRFFLNSLHISSPALTISGGVILFLIAIKMIFPAEFHSLHDENSDEPLIVPLAIPAVAGPTSIAMLILYSTKYPDKIFHWLFALVIAWVLTLLILLLSNFLNKILGSKIIHAIEKLMGIILTTMAVEMLITGIKAAMQ